MREGPPTKPSTITGFLSRRHFLFQTYEGISMQALAGIQKARLLDDLSTDPEVGVVQAVLRFPTIDLPQPVQRPVGLRP
jgi:hypothetical protein